MSQSDLLADALAHGRIEAADVEAVASNHLTLFDRFGVPPFSIMDTKSGAWQDRRRAWVNLGIESELGRSDGLLGMESIIDASKDAEAGLTPEQAAAYQEQRGKGLGHVAAMKEVAQFYNLGTLQTTSVFDPTLCEILYRWFSPQGGQVLDPFAGGSVRGIVASRLGRRYTGIDLRVEQIDANYAQAERLECDPRPLWIPGDSGTVLADTIPEEMADFVLTCPPYYDLEQYSDDPADLSNAGTYHDFLEAYGVIINLTAAALKTHRFCAWVVGDIRGADGNYRGLTVDTIRCFEDAGLHLYNHAILVNAVGTLAVRTSRQFPIGRKLGKQHQDVLIFVKGDGRKAADACGPVDMEDGA